jgi:hypothetical protein
MVSLIGLPIELITQIFEHFADAHPNTIYNILFTCMTLHWIAKDIICKHIYLSASKYADSRLQCFMYTGYADGRIARSIRLQLERDLLMRLGHNPTDTLNDLDLFCPRLRRFEQLTTFSLNQEGQTGPGIILPSAIVHNILAHLPSSVTNLELDTSGCDDRPQVSSNRANHNTHPDMSTYKYQHICPEINRLMAQLKCLRLRVPRLCPVAFGLPDGLDSKLVPIATSPLQVILLRLDSVTGTDISEHGSRDCTLAKSQMCCNDLGQLVQLGHFPEIKIFRVAYWQGRPLGEGIIRDLAKGGLTASSWHRYEGPSSFIHEVERGIEWTEYPNRTRRPEFMTRSGYNGGSTEIELRGRPKRT